MPASAFTPEEEFVWVSHENPDILPAYVARSALDAEDGMATNGWSEMKPQPDVDEDGNPIVESSTRKHTKKADHAAATNPED